MRKLMNDCNALDDKPALGFWASFWKLIKEAAYESVSPGSLTGSLTEKLILEAWFNRDSILREIVPGILGKYILRKSIIYLKLRPTKM